MKLWDMLVASQYMQIFSIYVTNVYDQNIPVARGTRSEMQEYDLDNGDLFYHLMDEVEYFNITKKGVMVIFLKDGHYEERAESQYSEDYVKKWDHRDPLTRPYLFGIETEEHTNEWICRFPCEIDKKVRMKNERTK